MNTDQISGGLDQAAGRVQGAVGALVDDTRTQVGGKLKVAAGRAQSLYGDARQNLENRVAEKPIAAMAALGAVGLAAGLLFGKARGLGRKARR